jgi:hypothetical protein
MFNMNNAACAFRGHRSRAGSFASAPIQNPDPLFTRAVCRYGFFNPIGQPLIA